MNKKQAHRRQQQARAHRQRQHEPRVCIFCFSNKNAFTAPEHILSEALGNKQLILPPGVVCDPCDHGPLSGLDKALVEFPPLQLIRVLWSLQRKKGGYATAQFSNGTVTPIRALSRVAMPAAAVPTRLDPHCLFAARANGRGERSFSVEGSLVRIERVVRINQGCPKIGMTEPLLDRTERRAPSSHQSADRVKARS